MISYDVNRRYGI